MTELPRPEAQRRGVAEGGEDRSVAVVIPIPSDPPWELFDAIPPEIPIIVSDDSDGNLTPPERDNVFFFCFEENRHILDIMDVIPQANILTARLEHLSTLVADVAAVMARATPRTRLALVDHVTSQTGLVLPVGRIVAGLRELGVETLVDGAHAPGMLPLALDRLGAAYYTGNCHKWLCAPKGAAFLHVRRDLQASVRPAIISHGANATRRDRSRFLIEFDWVGTDDPTACLAVPAALDFMGGLLAGGWDALREHNRSLALAGRALLCETLRVAPPCPEEMIGSLASLPLPDGDGRPPASALYLDPLQNLLLDGYGIEVPVIPWPAPPRRLLRISAQVYNRLADYRALATALAELLPPGAPPDRT
jgi:isopenicillin-N epimerase